MANVQIEARTNESLKDFKVQVTAAAVPPANPEGVKMTLLMKEVPDLVLNQVAMVNWFGRVLDWFRDDNILTAISDGDFVGSSHVAVSIDAEGAVVVNTIAAGALYATVPASGATLAIGVDAFYASQGWTIEMDTLGEKLIQAFLESFLKKA